MRAPAVHCVMGVKAKGLLIPTIQEQSALRVTEQLSLSLTGTSSPGSCRFSSPWPRHSLVSISPSSPVLSAGHQGLSLWHDLLRLFQYFFCLWQPLDSHIETLVPCKPQGFWDVPYSPAFVKRESWCLQDEDETVGEEVVEWR